MILFKNQIN